MDTAYHGGECCGITHIFDFDSMRDNTDDLRKCLDEIKVNQPNHLVEVVLTDNQLRNERIGPVVKRAGFRVVNRILNGNSGNYINILHKIIGPTRNTAKSSPFWKIK